MAKFNANLNVLIGRLGDIGVGINEIFKGIFEADFSKILGNLGKGLGNIFIGIGNLFIDSLNQGLSAIGVEIDRIEFLAFEKISDGDGISKGIDKITNSFRALSEAEKQAGNNAKEYAEALFDLELANAKTLANSQKLLAQEDKLKNIRDDDKKSFEDRIAANQMLRKVEEKRVEGALRKAKARLKLEEDFLKTIPENLRGVEEITKVEEARLKVFEEQEKSREIERESIIKNGELARQALQEDFELQEEIARDRLQTVEEGSQEELEIRKELLRTKANIELQSETENSKRREIIIRKTFK